MGRAESESLPDRVGVEPAALKERARIARDLHDGVGAELTALLWQCARLRGEPAERVRGAARRALRELRAAVHDLRDEPSTLGELLDELAQSCRNIVGDGTLCVACSGELARLDLSADVVTHVRRALLELVRNAVRHGRATRVAIEVASLPVGLRFSVADDGSGMEPVTASRGGLANVRARARELGGDVVVESPPVGARIHIDLPLPPRALRAPAA